MCYLIINCIICSVRTCLLLSNALFPVICEQKDSQFNVRCAIFEESPYCLFCVLWHLYFGDKAGHIPFGFWCNIFVSVFCVPIFFKDKAGHTPLSFWFWGKFLHLSYSIRDVDPCSPPTSHWRGQVGEQTKKLHARQVQDHGSNAFIFHPGSRRNKIRGNVHWTRKSGSSSKKEKYNSILQKERWVHDWEILKIPACILFVYQEK